MQPLHHGASVQILGQHTVYGQFHNLVRRNLEKTVGFLTVIATFYINEPNDPCGPVCFEGFVATEVSQPI